MDLDDVLQQRFGLEAFRPWQREAIDALLGGTRSVLVVAPTGGGKSLCYQLPAAVLEGTSLVVSPLIALMDDQVRGLRERGIEATYIASTLDLDERRRRERAMLEGRYQLVYLAPERLRSGAVMNMLARMRPPLVAIDEAHCISQWGHDFRPDYLRLGEVLDALAPPRVLACTATATPTVRREILDRLGMSERRTTVVLRGFARPNLHLAVEEIDSASARRTEALRNLSSVLGSPDAPSGGAIVYAGTRKATERFAGELEERGWRAGAYHAGIDPSERQRVSDRFAGRDLDVVVATNAFGMGIDRPDIRTVVHLRAPGSIEAYYQEVGRAGRDGEPAHGLLISGSADYGFRRRLVEQDSGPEGHAVDPEVKEHQWRLFLDLMRYVEAGSCRHDFILRYFGDEQEMLGGCGHCDVCARLAEVGPEGMPRVDEEASLLVRKALSGVARFRGRAGLKALASSLAGKDLARLRQMGLDQLSTHGILSARSEAWIMALLRRLMTAALVDLTPDQFPVPFLTPKGRETMTGAREVQVIPPPEQIGKKRRKRRAAKKELATDVEVDGALFERLREARLDMARSQGVPAFVVCGDRTLRDMAAKRPASLPEMRDVYGMGPVKVETYGTRFLEALRSSE